MSFFIYSDKSVLYEGRTKGNPVCHGNLTRPMPIARHVYYHGDMPEVNPYSARTDIGNNYINEPGNLAVAYEELNQAVYKDRTCYSVCQEQPSRRIFEFLRKKSILKCVIHSYTTKKCNTNGTKQKR